MPLNWFSPLTVPVVVHLRVVCALWWNLTCRRDLGASDAETVCVHARARTDRHHHRRRRLSFTVHYDYYYYSCVWVWCVLFIGQWVINDQCSTVQPCLAFFSVISWTWFRVNYKQQHPLPQQDLSYAGDRCEEHFGSDLTGWTNFQSLSAPFKFPAAPQLRVLRGPKQWLNCKKKKLGTLPSRPFSLLPTAPLSFPPLPRRGLLKTS